MEIRRPDTGKLRRRDWYIIFIGGTLVNAQIALWVSGLLPATYRLDDMAFWAIMSLSNLCFYLSFARWKHSLKQRNLYKGEMRNMK